MERLRRRAPSSHRSGPASKLVTRRLRVGTAVALPLALLVLALTGVSALNSGVTVVGMQGSCLQLQVGSGTYRFHSTTS